MLKIIKKSLIILLLVTIDIATYIVKIIYNFFKKNKSIIEKYSNGIYSVLKEELGK